MAWHDAVALAVAVGHATIGLIIEARTRRSARHLEQLVEQEKS